MRDISSELDVVSFAFIMFTSTAAASFSDLFGILQSPSRVKPYELDHSSKMLHNRFVKSRQRFTPGASFSVFEQGTRIPGSRWNFGMNTHLMII